MGGSGKIRFRLEPAGELLLSDVRIVEPDPKAEAVLIFVFDTTRRDAIGLYGCRDPSTPSIDRMFAGGWKIERAYAPASWTIPSTAALMTGLVPSEQEDADGSALGIRPGIETLAGDFRRAGFSTAAFIANPTLNAGNGFARGFDTFFTTPYEGASITLPGRETARHVPRWLASHAGEPVLLYLHLLDPHDPYTPADRARGTTPFDSDYRGPIVGDEIHRLYIGDLPRPPERDIRHLEALYHDEVRLADEELGKIWNGAGHELRDRATLVFTSDHGEELGEHQGWKHGPALYDEVLRVPLLLRSSAMRKLPRIPPQTLVSLLDLLPTIEELTGLPAPTRRLDGKSLLDAAAWTRTSLPVITMLSGGAPRAVVVHAAEKFFFFDRFGERGIPDPLRDPEGARLALRLPGILPAVGRFDLVGDPGEKNLLPIEAGGVADDWLRIEQAIGGTRKGLEIRAFGPDRMLASLDVRFSGLSRASKIERFALEPDDKVTWEGPAERPELALHWNLGKDSDGALVSSEPIPESLIVRLGKGTGCADLVTDHTVRLMAGRDERVPASAISGAIPRFEHDERCSAIFLWMSSGRLSFRSGEEQDEERKKLRAIGYVH